MIPLKLETLLQGRVVEQDRVEYKRGWNPSEIITIICAYANDFSNTNGGYIVIGIEEKYGRPLLPPVGLDENQLDKIQQELFQYCNFITPRYIPQTEVVYYQGKALLYLWCSAGDGGPYSAPEDVHSKDRSDKHKQYWIKPSSVKTAAKGSELSELFSKFNSTPFDDRINRGAKITDIRRGYLEDFLVESNSSLASEINSKPMEDLLVALEVANITDVGLDIRNIGLLMFAEHPEKFLPGAQIELIRFHSPDAEGSDDFTEKLFTGPIQKQVRDALSYIKAVMVEEMVVKHPDRAEADRFFSYPYDALEEILVNAVFHKSYQIQEPVEIRIYVDCIKIINYPGPEKYIDMEKLKSGTAIARRYRNRRIGEFLKEIDLSEKKSTGITKILRVLKANGSPLPEFETDEERSYFIVTIKAHKGFEDDEPVNEPVNEIVNEPINVDDPINEPVNADDPINAPINDPISDPINRIQSDILGALNANNTATYEQLAAVSGVSAATVKRNLKKLQSLGLVIRHGSKKSGYWEVVS
jgi:ATP-dependent DNA helicase RecG